MVKDNKDVLLELIGVSKSFGSLEILKNIDLKIHAAEMVSIVGPSGSGKSTLLHIAGLMDHPTQGQRRLDQQDVSNSSEAKLARFRLDTIGFVFQFHHLLPDFNVLENVLMPAHLANDDLLSSEKEARSILDGLGMGHRLSHKPYELSGGEQQRASFARALIRHPKLLLCDEPTGNLDSDSASEIGELIESESKKYGVGVILVTHNEVLAKRADRVLRLVDGQFEKNQRRS